MLWHKIIKFLDTIGTKAAMAYENFGFSDYTRAQANRIDQTSSAQVVVDNEASLKCTLEDVVIDNVKQVSFIRVALNGLGSFNTALGHDGADTVLQSVIATIRQEMPAGDAVRYFRSGADWVLVFTGAKASENQKQAAVWLLDQKNWFTVPETNQQCALSVLALTTPLSRETLSATYQVINALRPGKNTIAESLKDIRDVQLPRGNADLQINSATQIFNEISPKTAPRMKFAIGTVAVPVRSMALMTIFGI